VRLLSYNIRYGGVGREKPIAAVINSAKPDVVILEEAVRPEVVEKLAGACGMKAWGALFGHSLAFLSRLDVTRYAWHQVRFAKRQYLELQLAGSGLRFFGVHLSAIHSNVTERRRSWELRSLLSQIGVQKQQFHLVTGDFNSLAPGEPLDERRLPLRLRALLWMTGGRVHWLTIQHMLDAGYVDGYRKLHSGSENGYTFPTWDPHLRLDYTFVPAAFATRLTRCEVLRDGPWVKEASDHFPLVSEITE